MKNILITLCFLFSICTFSQKTEEYNLFIANIKKESKVDKTDNQVLNLLNDFYQQALQSDDGELDRDISTRIQNLYSNKKSKNMQILTMFLAYQEHLNQTAAVGQLPNSNFQLNLISDLENELQITYNTVPAIIRIYKVEALNSDGKIKESGELVRSSFIEYPNSIPLKVYKYLSDREDSVKNDLVKNHSNHWMVQQFEIK